MYRLLITGASGQVGSELAALQRKYSTTFDMLYVSRQDLDICADADAWAHYLTKHQIDAVINAAAYTKVDKAESEPDLAFAINQMAVEQLSRACANCNCALVHYSTDFVFDGTQNKPYSEATPTSPLSVYGQSKLRGEQVALAHNARTIVLRTAWVYSKFGNNFVKTMRRLSAEREQINVVYDQVGSPTHAADLADATLALLCVLLPNPTHAAWGEIFNYTNLGVTSWFDFAYNIIQQSNPICKVMPIESKDYPTPAVRPAYSVLSTQKIRQVFGLEIPYWRDSLMRCLQAMNE